MPNLMDTITKIKTVDIHLAFKLEQNYMFLAKEDVEKVKSIDRLMPVLVRCGGGRFTCPIQDLNHFMDILGKEGSDYVRDVSLV